MIAIFWATVLVQTPEGWLVAMNCYTSYALSDGHEALQLEFVIILMLLSIKNETPKRLI